MLRDFVGIGFMNTSRRADNIGRQELSERRMAEDDLAIARTIQAAMIPRSLPRTEGLEMASVYLPCGLVGGDLFDVVQISEDLLGFLIFDVSGHGVASALIASVARVSFLTHIRAVSSPRAVLDRVNEEMCDTLREDFFISAFVAFLDLHNNKLFYANAGHTPPFLYRNQHHDLQTLETNGLFVGIFGEGYYEERSVYLSPGDWLFLHSNGLYAVFDPGKESRGRKLLQRKLLDNIKDTSPSDLLSLLKDEYRRHSTRLTTGDDIGVISVEILTQSRKDQIKVRLGFEATDPVYLQFISYFEEMDKTAATILRDMDEYGYADDSIRKMKIALTELLANAIYHGNDKDHFKKVTIGHVIRKEKVVVSVMDEGEGFDYRNVPDPTLPENLEKDRGRGLFIVRNYVDELDFSPKGNRVTITKHHRES